MTSPSNVFGPVFMSISSLVLELWQFKGLTRNLEIGNTLVWVLANIWRLGQVRDTRIGTNFFNKMILNTIKFKCYSFYCFWVIKLKPTGSWNYLPHLQIQIKYQPFINFTKNRIKTDRLIVRSSRPDVFCKKVFLEILQNSQENNCARLSFLITLQASSLHLYWKRDSTQAFSCEFCKILKNIFSYRTTLLAASW